MTHFGHCLTLTPLAVPAIDVTYALAIVHPVRSAYLHCRHKFVPAVFRRFLRYFVNFRVMGP